ncbi:MAG: 3'-5' exonuclease [Thermotogae bacterium]|nr:MAG: 3'-5' exonuclease [Thermotogota bacterium]RKX43789.1 MAG: 3'-5' exonuclease [Thermotogota bacterium]
MILWENTIFCAMDTETTGVDPMNGDRIIEIAMVPIYRGKVLLRWSFQSLVNPIVRIPALTEKVHGISNSQISDAPTMEEIFPTIAGYVRKSILVLHHGDFDLSFLDMEAKEIGTFPLSISYVDTSEISKTLFGETKSLTWLAHRYGFDEPNHRALDDAVLTCKVFLKMMRSLGHDRVKEFIRVWRGRDW